MNRRRRGAYFCDDATSTPPGSLLPRVTVRQGRPLLPKYTLGCVLIAYLGEWLENRTLSQHLAYVVILGL